MIRVAVSLGAYAAVVTFPQHIATGETIYVRGAPGWPFSAITGVGIVASAVYCVALTLLEVAS